MPKRKPIEQAFLESILESPDDDAPRLIYADWLEENGQPERAEFIRVQCEMAKLPECEFVAAPLLGKCLDERCDESLRPAIISCRSCNLRRRERESLEGKGGEWAANALCRRVSRNAITGLPPHWAFRRGFIEEITITLADWLEHGPALVKVAPLRVVRLSGDCWPVQMRGGWTYSINPNIKYPAWFDYYFMNGFRTEADALAAMSRCCLEYAHGKDTQTVQT